MGACGSISTPIQPTPSLNASRKSPAATVEVDTGPASTALPKRRKSVRELRLESEARDLEREMASPRSKALLNIVRDVTSILEEYDDLTTDTEMTTDQARGVEKAAEETVREKAEKEAADTAEHRPEEKTEEQDRQTEEQDRRTDRATPQDEDGAEADLKDETFEITGGVTQMTESFSEF